MKTSLGTLIAGAIVAAMAAPAGAQAPPPAPVPATLAVTYLEVMPSAKADAVKLIKEVAAASRKEPGNLRYEVLQRMDRDNQFAILEAWNDPDAFAMAHVGWGLDEMALWNGISLILRQMASSLPST